MRGVGYRFREEQAEQRPHRLVLLFFAITAAAIGFIYLYVVPQLRSSLTSQKLQRLETVARPPPPLPTP